MSGKETLVLSAEEVAELERIVLDRDEPAALAFLRQTVWKGIRAARRRQLDPRPGARPRL